MIFQYFLCIVYRTINDNLTRVGTNLFLQFISSENKKYLFRKPWQQILANEIVSHNQN